MTEGGGETGPGHRGRWPTWLPSFPPAVRWLFMVLVCFPVPNFLLMLMTSIGMENGWQAGEWARCGDQVLLSYFRLSWLVFLPVLPALAVAKMRMPVVGLLTAWTLANFFLPAWIIGIIESSCGPKPWL